MLEVKHEKKNVAKPAMLTRKKFKKKLIFYAWCLLRKLLDISLKLNGKVIKML